MGLATQRRNEEAREAARHQTADPVPTNILYADHTRIVQELTKKYELQLSALRAELEEATAPQSSSPKKKAKDAK